MWSLGVLLYTLLFSENPFCSVEETLQARLHPPCEISTGLKICFITAIRIDQRHVTNYSCTTCCFVLVLELYALLAGLLHPVVDQRLNLEELLESQWIQQPINLAEYSWGEVFPSSNGIGFSFLYCGLLCYQKDNIQLSQTYLTKSNAAGFLKYTILSQNPQSMWTPTRHVCTERTSSAWTPKTTWKTLLQKMKMRKRMRSRGELWRRCSPSC